MLSMGHLIAFGTSSIAFHEKDFWRDISIGTEELVVKGAKKLYVCVYYHQSS